MEMENETIYALWLYSIDGIGEKTCRAFVESFGNARQVYEVALHGNEEKLPLDKIELKGILSKRKWQSMIRSAQTDGMEKAKDPRTLWESQGIHMVVHGQAGYPERLMDIPDPPFILFFKGTLPAEEVPSVAIVGARECSAYGEFVARELGKSLGKAGIQVISGMAKGIDGISQGAALEENGRSFGVLGSGVDVCYPKTNQKLYERLCEKGGVISAYFPGTVPTPNSFPPRNRIVSGLADALIVVEARAKSGTLITVDMALEQGKDVFVVPGRIIDRLSDGCNRLLALGATPVLTPTELIGQLQEICRNKGIHNTPIRKEVQSIEPLMSDAPEEKQVSNSEKHKTGGTLADRILANLERTPVSTGQIVERLQHTGNTEFGLITMELLKMCAEGRARQISPGQFVRVDKK